ncbi:SLC25A17 isoform 7 [Pan troglodytes]|uniref:Solute carrier family 25 member 17 n=2 Tax=Homininae TaxID=207598 RepID=F8WCN9_HUMAN|nr:solute carrier family 25 member 17 [Homo sapiens]KAI4003169.1 solute carrier family 25 member 17 [Homo sapiens]PNI48738.1 SLC25A17 isoform 7 [Pan troglodytes]
MASVLSYESLVHAVAGAVLDFDFRLMRKENPKLHTWCSWRSLKKKDSWHHIEGGFQ